MSIRNSKKSIINEFHKQTSNRLTSYSNNHYKTGENEQTEIAITIEETGAIKIQKDDDENLEESDEEFNIEIDSVVVSNNREELVQTKDETQTMVSKNNLPANIQVAHSGSGYDVDCSVNEEIDVEEQ